MTSRFQQYRKDKKDEYNKMKDERDYWKRVASSRADQITKLEAFIKENIGDGKSENSGA